MSLTETPYRIEPALLEDTPQIIADVVAELSASSARLASGLHPQTAANLADLVRLMNTYYSNLIEGHNTRPRDIERALVGQFDSDVERRNLQTEAAAHIQVQKQIDDLAARGELPEPASSAFVRWVHMEFYKDAPQSLLEVTGGAQSFVMEPGAWRSLAEHDVAVGRHVPPSSERVDAFMKHFEERFRMEPLGKAGRIIALAAAHHRFNFIHPFPDGNGRVSRLMSHAMGYSSGIAAHGLWSVSRGLARGLESRGDYKKMMDLADSPRQGDLDGRGNLSLSALVSFVHWFLRVCVDQVEFMSSLFELNSLARRLQNAVDRNETLKPQASRLLLEALFRGSFPRGEAARIMGLPERTARRVLNDTIDAGLLGSNTPKGEVSLRFPSHALDILFPALFPEL